MKNSENIKVPLSKSIRYMIDNGYHNIFNTIQYGDNYYTPHNRSLFALQIIYILGKDYVEFLFENYPDMFEENDYSYIINHINTKVNIIT